ncbi:MAG: hypothetical protein FWD24_04405 [Treponema sp.]|nr:hypothetical protein [Treponema sp.]
MEKYGKQRKIEDDKTDPTGFLNKAREHQSKFRLENLNLLDYDEYGNYLTENDAKKGLNFYNNFGIFTVVKEYIKFNKNIYQNMLRSEHIPFNLFIPLDNNKIYLKNVFNEIFNGEIKLIDLLKIEYAPQPKEKYLNDKTSFDVYIEYTRDDDKKGIIGIEIKYTERGYKIGKKECIEINNYESIYYEITNKSNVYKDEIIIKLQDDDYRQIWRNHLLGESILIKNTDKFKYFTSITFYPQKNEHFNIVSKQYKNFLKEEHKDKCLFITYEKLMELLSKHCPDDNYKKWIEYLNTRYIF